MSTSLLFALALVIFHVGITLTFLMEDEPAEAPLPALARIPFERGAR